MSWLFLRNPWIQFLILISVVLIGINIYTNGKVKESIIDLKENIQTELFGNQRKDREAIQDVKKNLPDDVFSDLPSGLPEQPEETSSSDRQNGDERDSDEQSDLFPEDGHESGIQEISAKRGIKRLPDASLLGEFYPETLPEECSMKELLVLNQHFPGVLYKCDSETKEWYED